MSRFVVVVVAFNIIIISKGIADRSNHATLYKSLVSSRDGHIYGCIILICTHPHSPSLATVIVQRRGGHWGSVFL